MRTAEMVDAHIYVRILGIRFLDADVRAALGRFKAGGLMVVPSGPGLAALEHDPVYSKAVSSADFALVDSFYLALLWFLRTGHRLHRVSGLAFMRAFIADSGAKVSGETMFVCPSDEDARVSGRWLRARGWNLRDEDIYVAPKYGPDFEDSKLLDDIEKRRPNYVVLCVGGGTQEPLGYFLRRNLSYRPGIACTGAALAFLTGQQATIPTWVDRGGMGWLARSIQDPVRFLPRYVKAVPLLPLLFRYGARPPVTKQAC